MKHYYDTELNEETDLIEIFTENLAKRQFEEEYLDSLEFHEILNAYLNS